MIYVLTYSLQNIYSPIKKLNFPTTYVFAYIFY
jgi:hypothetical protein